jgi:hypothetical protein
MAFGTTANMFVTLDTCVQSGSVLDHVLRQRHPVALAHKTHGRD